MLFQAASKFVIVSVKLILSEVVFDGFTGPRQKSDARYENDANHIKGLRMKIEIITAIFK